MSLAHPGWLMLALILPFILLGAILAHRGRSKAWQRMIAPRLRKQLVSQASQTRRWLSLTFGLLGAAMIIIVIARPYVGETTTTEQIKTRNILIAIDTSRSMLVKDGSPDRVATAQATALELLETFPNDRIGIIAFSGAPVLMVPLTIDHAAVHETVSQLDTTIIPTGGSDLNAAVQLALNTFEKTGQKTNALILISDGENHSQETEITADAIRKSGTTVCSISVGSEAGGIIPDYRQPDGKFRDIRNQTVLSRMIPDALDTLSRAGRGVYLQASSGVNHTVKTTLESVKRHQQDGQKRTIPNEKYTWFLLPATVFLTLSILFRSQLFTTPPKITTAATLLILLTSLDAPLHAAPLDQAKAAYDKKNYSSALTLFEVALNQTSGSARHGIEFAMGSSAYRLKQWNKATSYFSSALLTSNQKLQENAHYNLAQSLFRSGLNTLSPDLADELVFQTIATKLTSQNPTQPTEKIDPDQLKKITTSWQDAMDHYQAAIALNTDNAPAASNFKNVQRLLELLKQSQQKEQDLEKNQDDQGHRPETDPNNDPDQQQDRAPKDKGSGDDPDKQKDDQGNGNKDDPNQTPKDGDPSGNNDNQSDKQPDQPNNQPEMNRKDGETEEAYAARILKENSDAETRPVQRQIRQLRRPAKDW